MSDITIKIDGMCSVRKSDLGREIGLLLKDLGFGKVKMIGKDKRMAFKYKGLHKESVEIKVQDQTIVSPVVLDYQKMELNEKF